MNKKLKVLTLSLIMLLALGVFAGCSDSSSSSGETSDEISDTSSDSSAESEETYDEEDHMGEVSYVGSTYVLIESYESESQIDDYASVDTASLSDSGVTESVTVDDEAEYYYVDNGTYISTTADDLNMGDFIAITHGDDGTQQIIIITQGETDTDAQ